MVVCDRASWQRLSPAPPSSHHHHLPARGTRTRTRTAASSRHLFALAHLQVWLPDRELAAALEGQHATQLDLAARLGLQVGFGRVNK